MDSATHLHQHQLVKMVSPSWFEAVSSPDNEGCHPHSAQALKAFHEGKTTTHEAASAITHPMATSPSNHLDVERNGIWSLLISALTDWPRSETPALLQLLKAIQQVPDPAITEEAKWSVEDGPFWDGLPGFGHMWADDFGRREILRLCAGQDGNGNDRRELREKYVHVAGLEAAFCDQRIGGIDLNWGYERITDALERSDAVRDIEVPMAVEWLKSLPHRIYEGALKREEGWPLKRDLDLWTGGDVMTVERWQWWKSRLEEYVREGLPGRDSVWASVEAINAVECSPSHHP